MDFNKAKQIIESNGVIEVLHKGSPVWIEQIIDENIAEVSYIQSNKKDEIPLSELVEG